MKPIGFEISIDPQAGSTFAEQIRQQLIWLIASGQLHPGDTLPSIRQLAWHLSINLHTIRSAYQKLEEDGFVKTHHGKQAIVLPYNVKHLVQAAGTQRSHTIGITLPNMSNPFYHEFIRGVDEVSRQNQTMIFVCDSHENPSETFRYFAQLAAKHVDGIIAVSHSIPVNHLSAVNPTEEDWSELPLVTVDWPDAEGYVVLMDLENAGYQATHHLLEHNHRRIGLITFDREVANVLPVNRGYEKALQEAGIAIAPELIARVNGFDMQAGAAGARTLLFHEHPPTAIFTIADTLAFGAMRAIKGAGLQIPQDMALTSFNDTPFAELVDPPLTTVATPVREMGLHAMKMLQELIAGKTPVERKVILLTSLVVRKSCGCLAPS